MRTLLSTLCAPLVLLSLLGGSPVAAQMGGGGGNGPMDSMTSGAEDLIVPAAVRGDGRLGAFFVTDLWIKAAATGTATLEFHAADAPSSAATATATVALAQPVVYLPDVLRTSFGLSSAFGVLRVRSTVALSATVCVTNQTGAGAYGLAFMGMPARMGMTAMPAGGGSGMSWFAMYMLGLLPEPGNRVNVSVVASSESGATGVVEILDADRGAPAGSAPGSLPFSLTGYSSHQFNDVLASLHSRFGEGDAGLQVRVRMNQGTSGMVMAYAVVNDNQTNDGYVVMGTMMNAGQGMGGGPGR